MSPSSPPIGSDSHRPRIGVVSGRYPASDFESYVNPRAYWAQHGYTYIYCNWPTGADNRYMNKMEYVRAYYHLFDYLFWIDDDAFFMRLDQGLEEFLPTANSFLSICASPTVNGNHTYVSSGQFMLRCTDEGRAFIDEVTRIKLDRVSDWWSDELGLYTGGDQDGFVYLMKTDERFAQYDRHSHTAFNSRAGDVLHGDDVFLLHITGTVHAKAEKYRDVQRYLSRGPSLLTASEAERWKLEPPRTLARRILGRVKRVVRRLR